MNTPTYVERSNMAHPQIEWPRPVQPKKLGDISSGAPDRRCLENTAALLDAYRITVKYNLMSHAQEIVIPAFDSFTEDKENAHVCRIEELAERRGLDAKVIPGHLRILQVPYHPVYDWMRSAPWDGQDRLSAICYAITVDPEQRKTADLLISTWLLSCARAVMPEVKGAAPFASQGVLVLQGLQGRGKSRFVESLAPAGSGWIASGMTLDPHNRDSVEQCTSHWIVELGELDATYRKADISALKSFITRPRDIYRKSYDKVAVTLPRRTVFAGTVNPHIFLVDETGNRRWWTISCLSINPDHGVDLQQLWAQMLHLAESGVPWWLDDAETLQLIDNNSDYQQIDPVVEDMWEIWQLAPITEPPRTLKLSDIWAQIPGRGAKPRTQIESNKLANALKTAGAENAKPLHGYKTYNLVRRSVVRSAYVPPTTKSTANLSVVKP